MSAKTEPPTPRRLDDGESTERRLPYIPPRVEKRQSLRRVTLQFSGGGVSTSATGLTAGG